MVSLPIDAYLPAITDALREHRVLVLVAEPGAGKTTRVPPAILKANLLPASQPRLVMLQPRRLAARAAAERIASENDWTVGGDDVGYQVRFENKLTPRTRLRVVTEAILTNALLDDPSLDGVGCVVLDEFHERSIYSDLAIALLRDVRAALRDDLHVVVMSATLDAGPVATFLGTNGKTAPIVRVPGRTFPVTIAHRPRGGGYLEDVVANAVADAPDDGHTLVFLPGAAEIQATQRVIADRLPGRLVLPLYGSLPFDEQRRAVAPSKALKIVLATNIAETSLTIDGVRTVIDSGLSRQAAFDPQRGLDALRLGRISLASATQRAGRAGRTAEGRCVRLWSALEEKQMAPFDSPEIARVDLAPTLLELHAWGESDPSTFNFFEPPPPESIAAAERLLVMLGALDREHRLTPLGKRLRGLPVHPRLGRLLIEAATNGRPRLGTATAAILSEKDFVHRRRESRFDIASDRLTASSDVLLRVHALRGDAGGLDVDRVQLQQVRRVEEQLRSAVARAASRDAPSPARPPAIDTRLTAPPGAGPGDDEDAFVRRLVLLAYPDRVCRRRGQGSAAAMVGGGGVRLSDESAVVSGDYFVAASARQDDRQRQREAIVDIASRIEPAWLEELFPQSITRAPRVRYDESAERVIATKQTRYLDLVLREETDPAPDRSAVAGALAEALLPRVREVIGGDEALSALVARVAFAAAHAPQHPWPTFDDAGWRELLIDAADGKQSLRQVTQALRDAVRHRLVYPLDRLLDELAPESLTVPTGSAIRLAYNSDPRHPPVLAVRLQEMFGLAQTPRVAGGRTPVLLHLLGPNYRPVQVTGDLASFWKNTYAQVRKDLRADYPKHSWPDDPLTAEAIRGAKRRR